MKKILIVVSGLVVLVAVGWSVLWYMGRGEVEGQIDLEIARLDARGWTITTQDRSISGFPFGYEVHLDNVAAIAREGGMLIRLPELLLQWEPDRPTELVAQLPENFTASIPVPETARMADENLPAVFLLKGSAEAGLMTWQRGETGLADVDLTAGMLEIAMSQDDFPGTVLVSLSGLAAGITSQVDMNRSRFAADALEVEIVSAVEGEARGQADLSVRALSLSLASGASDLDGIVAIADGEPGIADMAFQFGAPALTLTISDNPAGADGVYRLGAGALTGLAELTSGQVTISTEFRQAKVTASPENAASPMRGEMTAGVLQSRLSLPTAPSEEPADGAVRLAVQELAADEIVWAYLDRENALVRDPGSAVLDLEATLRPQARLSEAMAVGAAVPFEVQNVIVNEVSASLMGAKATARGDLEMLPALGLPIGEIKIEGTGLVALLGALNRAGLLDEETLEKADALLQVYARPRDGNDSWETEAVFSERGLDVNGLPVQ